jgi:hypothetical protein
VPDIPCARYDLTTAGLGSIARLCSPSKCVNENGVAAPHSRGEVQCRALTSEVFSTFLRGFRLEFTYIVQ